MGEANHHLQKGKVSVKTEKGSEELSAKNIVLGHWRACAQPCRDLKLMAICVWTVQTRISNRSACPRNCWSSARARSASNLPASTTRWVPTRPLSRSWTACCLLRMPKSPLSHKKAFEKQGMKIMQKAMVKQLDRGKGKVTAHIEVGGKVEKHGLRHGDFCRGNRWQCRRAGA